jgi:hypothetical protein
VKAFQLVPACQRKDEAMVGERQIEKRKRKQFGFEIYYMGEITYIIPGMLLAANHSLPEVG